MYPQKSVNIPPQWQVSLQPIEYATAVADQDAWAARIATGDAPERIWLLEHPSVITAGTSARVDDLKDPHRFPVVSSTRGGQYTYHGRGQRIVYVQLNLAERGKDIRRFVCALEGWIIDTLATLGITAFRAQGRIGVWVRLPDGREAKIAAIGVRVRRWVTLHGFSCNIDPDLKHFEAIVPCGLNDFSVTSIKDLGVTSTMSMFDDALCAQFPSFLQTLS